MDIAKKKKASIRSGKKKAGPGYKTKIKMKKAKSDYYDFNLVAVIILIMCFGLIMLYSTSSYMAQINEGDDMFYFKKQAMYSIGWLVLAIVVSYFDYHILAKFPFVIYVAAAFLMVLVKTPLGVTSHGARRWLKLGVQFQPAEIAKIAVIITLSYLIVKMGKRVETLKATMVLLGMGGIQALFAYVFTDNLSTAMIIFGITVGLVFIAHPKTKPFVILAVVAVILVAILVYSLSHMDQSSNFRLRRIQVWLHPEDYASGDGYQTLQALYAIGSGGFFGRGLGNSIQKLGSVPEAQNDMIAAIFALLRQRFHFFHHLRRAWNLRRDFCADPVRISSVQTVLCCTECTGYVWLPACERCFCTYRFAGYYERGCSAEHHAKHRCHIAIYQLWRYLHFVPDGRDGTGLKCGQTD